jgi:hypothetical protein
LKTDSPYVYKLTENQKVVGMHVMGNAYVIMGLNLKIATLDKKAEVAELLKECEAQEEKSKWTRVVKNNVHIVHFAALPLARLYASKQGKLLQQGLVNILE